jgi:RHS repeat-associated protein
LIPTPGGTGEKFATYWRDSTGLDYADQRYHMFSGGRFLTADPYEASAGAGDPGSWNRYAYVGGDPVNRLDPRGLFEEYPNGCGMPGTDFCMDSGTAGAWFGSNGSSGPVYSWDGIIQASRPPCAGSQFLGTVLCWAPIPFLMTNPSYSPEQCPLVSPQGAYTTDIGGNVLAQFAPELAAILSAAFLELNQMGITPIISSGFRTADAQRRAEKETPYYAAAGGASWHRVGLAIDFKPKQPGSDEIREVMIRHGLYWGGNFSRPDPVHFTSARPGTSPDPRQIAACDREHP